jgi:acetoacetyl-CoA synthetase
MPGAQWFAGARLNYAEHVLAPAVDFRPAIIFAAEGQEPIELSWSQLRAEVGTLAAVLRSMGVQAGDRVAAYVSNRPEAVIAMLATTSIGAVWAACAPDFGAQSVVDRFAQIEPKILIALDGYRFGGRDHDRRAVVAELRQALPSVHRTILIRALFPKERPAPALEALAFDELTGGKLQDPEFAPVAFDHPLWILFSSGTTGIPKAIVHGHGGIVLEHLKALGLCLDLGPEDRYLFFSSTSWMAWNYLVGGLLLGATIVLYEGSPAHPSTDQLWRLARQTEATVLGMGAAYVTACEKAGVQLSGNLGDTALRTVIPTGSPLPAGGWQWLNHQLGPEVRIDAICGGTDVCTAFVGGSPLLPVKSGKISCRWLGVSAQAWSEDGRPVVDALGELVITEPMPSMPVMLWGDHDGMRYRESYFSRFPGVWRQGDWVTISADGSVVVWGRSDGTLNRGGVRLGSAEIYGVVERLPQVRDSLVVGVELPDGGYYMPLFIVRAESAADEHELRELIVSAVRTELSPRYVPDDIVIAPVVPRTLTGKKLEVPVKRILQGEPPSRAASLGSVDDRSALEWYEAFASRWRTAAGAAR